MRNTLEYPISKDEIMRVLERLEEAEITSDTIGSIDAVIFRGLRHMIDDMKPEEVEKYIKH